MSIDYGARILTSKLISFFLHFLISNFSFLISHSLFLISCPAEVFVDLYLGFAAADLAAAVLSVPAVPADLADLADSAGLADSVVPAGSARGDH